MKKRKFMFLISSFILASILVCTLIFTLGGRKEELPSGSTTTEETPLVAQTDITYNLSSSYDIPTGYLVFDDYTRQPNGELTCSFAGFNKSRLMAGDNVLAGSYFVGMSYLKGHSTLRIPETVDYNGQTYKVTKIKRIAKYQSTDVKDTLFKSSEEDTTAGLRTDNLPYIQFITAIVLPNSIQTIEEAAFYGYLSLQYLEVPFIGTKRGRDQTTPGEPLASMFAPKGQKSAANAKKYEISIGYQVKNESGILDYLPHKTDAEGKSIIDLDTETNGFMYMHRNSKYLARWYEGSIVNNNTEYYCMPSFLYKVKVNDDTAFTDRAFFDIKTLRSIEISDTVTTLAGLFLFSECDNLREVKLPANVGELGKGLFCNDTLLGSKAEMVDPAGNKTSIGADVTLPLGPKFIPMGAFAFCGSLETIYIPSTIVDFRDGAFKDCLKLKNIALLDASGNPVSGKTTGFNIPKQTTTIGVEAFRGCTSFTSVDLTQGTEVVDQETVDYDNDGEPDKDTDGNIIYNNVYDIKLQSIGRSAFNGCTSLASITLPFVGEKRGNEASKNSCFGWIFGEDSKSAGGTNNEEVEELGPGIVIVANTYLAEQRYGTSESSIVYFRIPSSLKTITIGNETHIRAGAFMNLSSVETIALPNTVASIASGSFKGCKSLKDLTLPFLGNNRNGRSLGLIFGSGLGAVDGYYNAAQQDGTFSVPVSLKSVRIMDQHTIQSYSFQNIASLETVEIGKRTQYMNESIFWGNGNLKKLIIPFTGWIRYDWNPRWPNYGWHWWWRDIQWRNSVQWLFPSCTTGIEEYQNNMLRYYDGYIKYFPMSLDYIEVTVEPYIVFYSFIYFSSVKTIVIGDRTTSIAEASFCGCSSLEEVDLPFIGRDNNGYGQSGAPYTFGWIFGQGGYGNSYGANEGYGTYYIPNGLKTINIRGTFKRIGAYAFANLRNVETIKITAPINALSGYAFYNDYNLSKIQYDNATYTTVSDHAFENCRNINVLYKDRNNYSIPDTVTTIGNYAFAGTSVANINENLKKYTSIGAYAFSRCSKITSVVVPKNVTYLGEGAFANDLYLQKAVLTPGRVAPWLFSNCSALETINLENVTQDIPAGMFYNCTSLYNGDRSNGFLMDPQTKTIGKAAFYGCERLTEMELGANITSIGDEAFVNCKGLESMTIPRSVQNIGVNGWNGCRKSYCFYVYDPEEYWPDGWSENWNCFYPVHVLGDADTSIFIYEFDIDTREYTIVGVKTGVELSGLLTIPSVHNGIRVTGIADGVLLNYPDINTIIIPKSIVRIGSEALGAYNSPVTVFMESTMQEAIDNRLHYLPEYDKESQMYLDPGYYNVDYENKWFQNMADGAQYITIYYHDYWTYGKSATGSSIPYLLLDKFALDLDPEQDEFYYDGITQHKRNVLSVSSRGLRISPNYTFDQDGNTVPTFLSYDTSLFNITYRNNISAGTAYVYAEINETALKKYNNEQIANGNDPLYVTGRVAAGYTIKKATVNLFWIGSEADAELFVKTKVYDGQPWTCSKWDSTNTLGLGSHFRLEGTLRTVGVNAGSYNIGHGFDDPQYGFRWTSRWYIYDERNNNVSSNFEVEISDGLNVEIVPRDIYVEWTGGSWSRQEGLEKQYYLYPYTGVIIQPTAVAKDVKTKKDVSDICTLQVEYETQVDSEKAKRPTYDKETMSVLPHCSADGYLVFAYLSEKYRQNFNICDESGNALEFNRIYDRQQEEVRIQVTKGYITIKINYPSDNPYLIPEDDDYYYCTNWKTDNRKSVVGLGPNSTIIGRYRTADAKPQLYSTARGDFYWDTTYEPAYGKEFEIMNSDGTNETDYYELNIWAEVIIKYHTFQFDYFIDDSKLSGVNENGTDAANNRVAKYTYITEGKRHVFSATPMKSSGVPVTGADLDVVYTYYDDAGVNHDRTHNKREFIDPEKTYNLTIIASRKNYVTAYVNFILEVKKSKVIIGSLSKEYDRLPVDPYEKIIKIAHTEPEYEDDLAQHQIDTLTFKYYNADTFNWADKENNTLISAPSEIGSYIVHATCEASRFFYALDTWETFNITPRTITIDLAQEGSSMLYSEGVRHEFDPRPSEQQVVGGPGSILIGHQFLGTIATISDQPGLYDGIEDWEWIHGWAVIDLNNNSEDVSKYYQIRYINSFRIELLQMNVSVTNFDGVYDGAFHSVDVTVTDQQNGSPLDTATVYYSTVAITESNDTPDVARYWSVYKPTYKAPGRYDVWMKVVADHYETKYVSGYINIVPDEITFTVSIDGLKTFDYPNSTGYESYVNYDGQAHKWEITDLNPWYAELFYSVNGGDWTTEAPILTGEPGAETLYKIRVQVRADYYDTVDYLFPFTIGEKDLAEMEDGWIIPDNQRYIYEKGTLRHLNITVSETAPFTIDNCKIYYSIDQENWTTTNYDFENVGFYKVYFKVVVNGYKVYGALGDRYGTVEINSKSFGGGGGGSSPVKPGKNPEELDIIIIVNDNTLTASAMTVNLNTDKTDGRLAEYTAEVNLAVGDTVKIKTSDDYEFVNYMPECSFRGTAKEAGKHTFSVRIYESGDAIWVVEPSGGGSGSHPYPNPYPGNPSNHLITINPYKGEYDGLAHGIEVDLSNDAFNSVRNDLKVEYTTNYDVYIHALKEGWSEEPCKYTDVGMYTVYIRVSAPNYTPIYGCGTVTITQADINPVTVTTETVEYNPNGINNRDIVVTTKLNSEGESFYDGTMKFTYYAYDEALGATGDYSTHEPVYPLERAKYIVVVYLYETKNCLSGQAQGVFEIVPKKLTVEYDAEVEYNGQAQNPNPRLNAEELAEIPNGENELKITWTIDLPEGETIATYPWDLGTYTYHLGLINPDGNYVLSTDTIEMTIIPRQVLIKFEEEMLYDSLQPKIWVKTDGWENCLSQTNFLKDHVYSATMYSNSSVRATYYLITVPDSEIVSSNIIYKQDECVTNTATGEDVTKYYHFIYDITVKIVYPSMEGVELSDETVYYDGNYHGITVTVPGTYDRAEVMFSEVDDDEQYQYSLKYVNCGTYPIYVRITHQNYEPFKQLVTLKIVPGHLKVDVKPYEAIYNAATHIPEYQITGIEELTDEQNAKITELTDIQPSYIKYYKQDEVTISELEDFYRNSFSEGSAIFTNGYNEVSEAGNYYVVVFYKAAENANWLNSVGITTFVIKQRDVFFKGYDLFASHPYDGKKKEVSLSGLTLMTDAEILPYVSSEEDLFNLGILTDYGHVLDSSRYSQYFIQTNSANSGLYRGATDFEFGKAEIIATLNPDGPINVVHNYHPIVLVDDGFRFEIEITKIDIQFTVEANEREYCAETQTYTTTNVAGNKVTITKLVPMLPYPIINTPDKDNPDLFFDCAVKLKIWRAEAGSTPENPMMGELIGINDLSAANVGEYVVMVQYSEGTNFNAYTGTDKVAYVKITPRGVSVTWSNTNVIFNNQPQKPKAHYVDILGNKVEADVYFYDSQLNIVDSVTTADTYQAFAGFESMAAAGLTSNYYIKDDSNMSYFVISPLVYEVPVHGSTYDTASGWTQTYYEEDIPGFMDGLHLMAFGSTSLTDEAKGATAKTVRNTPGVYFDDDITFENGYAVLNDAGEIVTSSIHLKAVGYVTIMSSVITYVATDFVGEKALVYDKDGYTILDNDVNALVVLYPSVNTPGYNIQYSLDEVTWVTDARSLTLYDVGTYTIYFKINCTNFDEVTDYLTIEIIQKEAYYEPMTNLVRRMMERVLNHFLITMVNLTVLQILIQQLI